MKKTILFGFGLLGLVLFLLLVSCKNNVQSIKPETNNKSNDGFSASQMNLKINPGDDFYDYAVGKWIAENKIPSEYSSWGTFNILSKRTDKQLKAIIKGLMKDRDIKNGTIAQKVKDFYISGVDVEQVNKQGFKPIQPELDKIKSIVTRENLVIETAFLQRNSCTPFFQLGASQDLKNSGMMILGLWQGGLGLLYKEYYLSDKPHAKELRAKYREFIKKEFELIGYDNDAAEKAVASVMKIETDLAKASRKPVDLRDPYKNYNPMRLAGLEKLMPELLLEKVFI